MWPSKGTNGCEITSFEPSRARTVVRECCKDNDESQGKRGNLTPRSPKNLNRWPPKFMWVTTSMISTKCKIVYKSVQVFQFFACVISRLSAQSDSAIFWSLRKATAETRAPILTQNTSNDAFPRKEVPFGVAKPQCKVSTPHFPPKRCR